MREIIEAIRNLTNRIQVLEVKEDPPTNILLFPQSSDLSLTTSYQDVPGCVHILPSNGFYLVEAICDVYTGNDDLDNGFYFQGRLEIDGVAQPLIVRAVLERTGGVRLGGLYKQTWRVALWDYRQIILKKSPVGYWRLGEKTGTVAHDESGNLNHGTYTGGITLNQLGALANDSDTAVLFDGGTGYVDLPLTVDPTASAGFTVGCWFKAPAAGGGTTRALIAQRDGTGTGRSWLYLEANSNKLASFVGNAASLSPLRYDDDQWHYAAVTVSGTTLRLYADGAEVTTATRTVEAADGGWVIGVQKQLNQAFFNGTIDEPFIATTALSAADALEDYNAGAGIGYSNASATIKLRASKSGGTGTSQLLRNNTQLVITQLGKI